MRTPHGGGGRARRWPWVLLGCATALGLLLGAFSRAGHFLVVGGLPRPADAILVLGGGEGERGETAVSLFRRGIAPLVVATGAQLRLPALGHLHEADLVRRQMVAEGVPPAAIRLLKGASSTYEEARLARAMARREGLKNLLVVSSPYHMRRARWTFLRVFDGAGVELQFVAARGGRFNPEGWWRREHDLVRVAVEYQKLVYYWLAYGLGLKGDLRGSPEGGD